MGITALQQKGHLSNFRARAVFLPTEFVDVTSVMEKKKAAFLCHESQVVWLRDHTHTDPCENMFSAADTWGRQCGVKYAEVFTQCYADGKICTRRLLPE